MRTPEEIRAQIDARVAEMEGEYKNLVHYSQLPCIECRWNGLHRSQPIKHFHHCHNPLIVGLENKEHTTVDWQVEHLSGRTLHPANWPRSYLCGQEKALWEPVPKPPGRLSVLERLGQWLCDLFGID